MNIHDIGITMNRKKRLLVICFGLLLVFEGVLAGGALALTAREEEKMGEQFIKAVKANNTFIEDPLVMAYVNEVAERVMAVMPAQPFTYHFYVVEEDLYNAFAGPGGHIFVNSGLIAAMESEAELAGILSHEISHVTCRHISEQIDRSKKISFGTLAGVAAGVLVGAAGGSGEAIQAITMGTLAAGQSVALKYSRENEKQADEIGLEYLTAAGYSAEGLILMLEKIRAKQWYGSEQIPTYLTTHPAPEDRVGYIRAWIDRNEGGMAFRKNDGARFALVHARIVGMYGDEKNALKQFEKQLAEDPGDIAAHYGAALAKARMGNRKAAVEEFRAALSKDPFNAHILTDLGRVYYLDGQYDSALKILASALEVSEEDDPEIRFYTGRTYLSQGRLKMASEALGAVVTARPDHREASYYLGESYGKLGRMGDAHYHLGVHYQNRAQADKALFHYRKALPDLKDPDKKLKAEEMIKKLTRQAKRPAEAGRGRRKRP